MKVKLAECILCFLLFGLKYLYLLDLGKVDNSPKDYLIEEKRVNFQIVKVTLLIAMDSDVAHDLYRRVDLMYLLRDLVNAPVSISLCLVALVRVQRAKIPICDGTDLCNEILTFGVTFDRMQVDTHFLFAVGHDCDWTFGVFVAFDLVLSWLAQNHFDVNIHLAFLETLTDLLLEALQTSYVHVLPIFDVLG